MDASLTSGQIRDIFIDFFKQNEHNYVHSSRTIPHNDPTLLFANAGMNQFKNIFLGTIDPSNPYYNYKRAVNSQKCIRAGGKHNDLDDVGKDNYHHTFFEMLGSWSFGDYFKVEAIDWAWQLLTEVYKVPKDRLYATYFEGNEAAGLEPDIEARDAWLKYLPESHVLTGDMKDNFWEMGEVGPCGPCSELHFDRIGGRNAAHLVNMDDPDVLEIWNLVFMQFNRETDKSLKPLANTHVDTGMGLERIVSVIQGKSSNYDTDLFVPFFKAIQDMTGAEAYTGKFGEEDAGNKDMAYRVLADHIRTLTIALSDGGMPDNQGRGYVLRRILRRAVRYAKDKLNAKPGMFSSLVDTVVEVLGDAFPEIKKNPKHVKDVIDEEEVLFLRTLTRGERVFNRVVNGLPEGATVFPGHKAWLLFETYGFPVDLTELMAGERGLTVDCEEYEAEKEKARELSKGKVNTVADQVKLDVHALNELKNENFPATDASFKYNYSKVEGEENYRFESITAEITNLRHDKQFVKEVEEGWECGVLLDRTCFYAEQGGQIYDVGFITKTEDNTDEKSYLEVTNCQVQGGYVLHVGKVMGTLRVGDRVELKINEGRRMDVMRNHTSTHILNFGLRQVLGEADQKGSLVDHDRLRFDFTANKALTTDQIQKTEEICNQVIDKECPVYAELSKLSEAKAVNGLRAVFDETYPDPVRVVSVGVPVERLLKDPTSDVALNNSVEFCGGTHILNSRDAKRLVITAEEAISKGIRRMVAVTGEVARRAEENSGELRRRLEGIEAMKKTAEQDKKVKEVYGMITDFKKDVDGEALVAKWQKDRMRSKCDQMAKELNKMDKAEKEKLKKEAVETFKRRIEKRPDEKVVVVEVNSLNGDDKSLMEVMKLYKKKETCVMLFSKNQTKVVCKSQVPKSMTGKMKAVDWVSEIASHVGGKAGGKDVMASTNGSGVDRVSEAVEIATKFAQLKLQD